MYSFKKWRAWLLSEIQGEVAAFNGIHFNKGGLPSGVIGGWRESDYYRQIISSEQRFLERFATLCKRFGFDPRIKKNWDRFQAEEGRLVREPECGSLSPGTAEASYHFYFEHYERIKSLVEIAEISIGADRRRKRRVPGPVAQAIIYALETNRKHSAELIRIREYLGGGGFKRDLNQISKMFKRTIRNFNQKHGARFPIQRDYPPPGTILKLGVNRGESDMKRWRAVWIHDLYRSVVTPQNSNTVTTISEQEKSYAKRKILSFGARKMKASKG